MKIIFSIPLLALLAGTMMACSPEVGSPEWCAEMKQKPKMDWSANELKEFEVIVVNRD